MEIATVFVCLVVLLLCSDYSTYGCYISGTDSGECTTDSLDFLWRLSRMPYCARRIEYPVCIPKFQTLPPSREFPEGRWFNHTVNSKDQWVGENAERWITLRLQLERDKTLRSQQTNEFGDDGRILKRFAGRSDCVNAFRNLFCWTNFPRCDKDRDLSFPTCRSSCENFFISCGIERGLWRCGKSKYFNGYSPESPTVTPLGNVSYLRDFYPGQPFRQNKYTRNRNEIPICTPAMTGSSSSFRIKFNILAVLVMILLALYFYL